MAIVDRTILSYGWDTNSRSDIDCQRYNIPEWKDITNEYNSARISLRKLADESATLGDMARQTLRTMDEQYERLRITMQTSIPYERALVAPMPPPIDRSKCRGILAYRAWDTKIKGSLSPSVMHENPTWLHECAFADAMPDTNPEHGLYATRLELWRSNGYADFVCGLVDLYGKIIEHSDGILRAECARIKCIFLLVTSENSNVLMLTGVYESFKLTYPLVPIYIFTPYQKQLFIWREVLVNYNMI